MNAKNLLLGIILAVSLTACAGSNQQLNITLSTDTNKNSILGNNTPFDCAKMEHDLVKLREKWEHWVGYDQSDSVVSRYDSLVLANDSFLQKLLYYTSNYPASINCTFQSLKGYTATSPDGKFRIYSWDNMSGGTMHFFNVVYQYTSHGKVYSQQLLPKDEEGEDPLFFCSAIYDVAINNKTYYLSIENGVYTSKDCRQSIVGYTIENDTINTAALIFKTEEGMKSQIDLDFDFFSVVDHPERPLHLILFDEKTKTLKVPETEGFMQVSHKYITYKFNGRYFEQIKK